MSEPKYPTITVQRTQGAFSQVDDVAQALRYHGIESEKIHEFRLQALVSDDVFRLCAEWVNLEGEEDE